MNEFRGSVGGLDELVNDVKVLVNKGPDRCCEYFRDLLVKDPVRAFELYNSLISVDAVDYKMAAVDLTTRLVDSGRLDEDVFEALIVGGYILLESLTDYLNSKYRVFNSLDESEINDLKGLEYKLRFLELALEFNGYSLRGNNILKKSSFKPNKIYSREELKKLLSGGNELLLHVLPKIEGENIPGEKLEWYVHPLTKWLNLFERGLKRVNMTFLHKLEFLNLSSNYISGIDLTPLAKCTSLKELYLDNNKISKIDLTPLSSTPLECLGLSRNYISTLDLTPLAKCTSLKELYLDNNKISKIDLTPLSSTQLARLDLSWNKISYIDLTPLSGTQLKHLDLKYNNISYIDLTPLINCNSLTTVCLDNNVKANFEVLDAEVIHFPTYDFTMILRVNK